jgi:hypothetical protein
MKIIVDRRTAVLAVCKLMNLDYIDTSKIRVERIGEIIPADEIVFDFEEKRVTRMKS